MLGVVSAKERPLLSKVMSVGVNCKELKLCIVRCDRLVIFGLVLKNIL